MWNELGKTTKQYRWTISAIECFKRGCVCDGCFYENFFSNKSKKCRMKVAVLELTRTQKIPQVDDIQILE